MYLQPSKYLRVQFANKLNMILRQDRINTLKKYSVLRQKNFTLSSFIICYETIEKGAGLLRPMRTEGPCDANRKSPK